MKLKIFDNSDEEYNVVKRTFYYIEKIALFMTKCKHLSIEDRIFYCRLSNNNPETFDFVDEFDIGSYLARLTEILFMEQPEVTEDNLPHLDNEAVYDALGFFLSRLGLTYPDALRLAESLSTIQAVIQTTRTELSKNGNVAQ